MKEKRSAAKAASRRAAAVDPPQSASFADKAGGKKRNRDPDASQVDKKQRAASEFPYQVDSSDHAETPAGEGKGWRWWWLGAGSVISADYLAIY
jgi:hypothetical protein